MSKPRPVESSSSSANSFQVPFGERPLKLDIAFR